MTRQRIGHGWDLHRLAAPGDAPPEASNPSLMVGGVSLTDEVAAVGHSDGDVVYHAVTDAVLGGLGQDDIGQLFPDDDHRWRGADSTVFIEAAADRMRAAGYAVGNLDVTVVLQRPKLSPHKPAIKANLARLLGCGEDAVNIKGKTHEHVDAIGEGRAIAAHAVVLLTPDDGSRS